MGLVGTYRELLDWIHVAGVASPAAETIIVTSDVIQTNAPVGGQRRTMIEIDFNITTGTGTTAIVVNVRRGSTLAGVIAASRTITLAAGVTDHRVIKVPDTTGWTDQAGGGQYVVTVAETGATANGTINTMDVEVYQ